MGSITTSGAAARPIAVDLDGTLLLTDVLFESANQYATRRPWRVFDLLRWALEGRAVLKSRIAQAVEIDGSALPFNQPLLAWLRLRKAEGRRLVLATASDAGLATQSVSHLQLFEDIIASDGVTNLKGEAKRDELVRRFGERGYEYVGDDVADLPVWKSAAVAHVAGATSALVERVRGLGNLGEVLSGERQGRFAALLRAMRPHQWLKNLLLFVPLFAAHMYGSAESLLSAAAAFAAFSLVASAVYLVNDLVDVQHDRHHGTKRSRPFAAGELGLLSGWIAWPFLLAAGLTLSLAVLPAAFAALLSFYAACSAAYSFSLKRIPMVDVVSLASLYTLRIVAGAVAIAVPLSFWLLLFSMFFFLSLAFLKRYGELKNARVANSDQALRGRGWHPMDLEIASSLGTGSGLVAVLVLALYIQDTKTAMMYSHPESIWAACPLLLYWISRAWMLANRGVIHEDPILFALTDKVSWLVLGLIALSFTLARLAA